MRVYFDNCCLNRPFDERAQLRVALEAEAILGMLKKCELGEWTLVDSEVVALENERNPDLERKAHVQELLEVAREYIKIDESVKNRALILEKRGYGAFDALHLAAAESASVEYFCTCDDRLLKKSRTHADLAVKVRSPLEIAGELSL